MNNLESCPFCDCPDYLKVQPVGNVGIVVSYAAVCGNCSARGPHGYTEQFATDEWNKARRQQPRTLTDQGVGYGMGGSPNDPALQRQAEKDANKAHFPLAEEA